MLTSIYKEAEHICGSRSIPGVEILRSALVYIEPRIRVLLLFVMNCSRMQQVGISQGQRRWSSGTSW